MVVIKMRSKEELPEAREWPDLIAVFSFPLTGLGEVDFDYVLKLFEVVTKKIDGVS